ncbi:MAG: hypothetical protein RIQ56_896 [Candidatus Parcubacteria bacterium]|jgi:hypothetical protein
MAERSSPENPRFPIPDARVERGTTTVADLMHLSAESSPDALIKFRESWAAAAVLREIIRLRQADETISFLKAPRTSVGQLFEAALLSGGVEIRGIVSEDWHESALKLLLELGYSWDVVARDIRAVVIERSEKDKFDVAARRLNKPVIF